MSLLTAELRKVWGNRVFPMLLAVLSGREPCYFSGWAPAPPPTSPPPRPTAPWGLIWLPWGSDMAAKGDFLHGKSRRDRGAAARWITTTATSPTAAAVTLQHYREENAELFDAMGTDLPRQELHSVHRQPVAGLRAALPTGQRVRHGGRVRQTSWTACRPGPGSWRASQFSRMTRLGMT